MRPDVVIGAGFGDEGKGAKVDRLCRQHDTPPLVVRFSGGHQAGHTVVTDDGRRHVFSQVGSGAFAGSDTLWSKHCTFEPLGFVNEVKALGKLGVVPRVMVDPDAPLVTPWDREAGRAVEESKKHGSCGVGFASTLLRHANCPLRVGDLLHPVALELRVRAVANYYGNYPSVELSHFLAACKEAARMIEVMDERDAVANRKGDGIVFEGSQGVLLDMRHGFYPHMTMSRTTSLNARAMIERCRLDPPRVWMVTRAYQTRHGNGPMTNEQLGSPVILPNRAETNVYNKWQGALRYAPLDIDMLMYSVYCESSDGGRPGGLTVTCLDQVDADGGFTATVNGVPVKTDATRLARGLGISIVEETRSECEMSRIVA